MAADHLVLTLECPACRAPVSMPTRTVYVAGLAEMHFGTAPVREHLASHQDMGDDDADPSAT